MGVLQGQDAQTVFFLAIGVELNGAGVYVLKYAIQGGCNGAGVRSCSCAGCSKRPWRTSNLSLHNNAYGPVFETKRTADSALRTLPSHLGRVR